MAIEWIFIKNEEELREKEELYCVAPGEFGKPNEYPVYGFLHADFDESQCIEYVGEAQLCRMLGQIKAAQSS